MQILNRIYDVFKSASLLAVVLMLAFTVPMSAHTNMADHGSMDHHEMHQDHSEGNHDMSVMDMPSPDNTNSANSHDGVGCCETGMCISAALIDNFKTSEAEQVHNHFALPISKMTSVDKPRLMRPPSL